MKSDKPDKNIFFDRVVALLETARSRAVQQVNITMVTAYFEIGRMIVEEEQGGDERATYGKSVLRELSKRLKKRFRRGFSVDNLENMRMFYLTYSKSETLSRKSEKPDSNTGIPQTMSGEFDNSSDEIQKQQTLSAVFNLSWSHYLKLMRIDDSLERRFYEIECAENNWSVRELQRQFDSGLYLRLAASRDKTKVKELSDKGLIIQKAQDAIKDPYILEFLGLPEKSNYSEQELETELINKLESFLLELGKGFTFVGRQKRITIDEKHFYIDLVFYNRLLQSFVLLDLKIGELKHQDLGQMQMYVNYYDRFVKLTEENKTVGIILCRDKSKAVVEITLPEDNKQIFASKYQTALPDKEELKKLLQQA
ncbi:MAG: PDDEXK nuclease domain-containing protein [Balneolales bacterium]|nr:PDDEXK nuclease domain-containing protein [Balneolales bacterium]